MAYYGLTHPGVRVAVIGPTAADARDTCVEGESGLLRCLPPSCVQTWNRSLGEAILTNGTRYKLFSADEPERLRGPQHHRAWCDELACLVPGTMIQTANGLLAIERVRPGMLVHTRQGLQPVIDAWQSSPSADVVRLRTSVGQTITGTAHHRIWTQNRGWIPLGSLLHGDILMGWEIQQNLVLHGVAVDGGSMGATTWIGGGAPCTALSTPLRTVLSRLTRKSITGTTTRRTIRSATLRRLLGQSISSSIGPRVGLRSLGSSASFAQLSSGLTESLTRKHASNAQSSSSQPARGRVSAVVHAKWLHGAAIRRRFQLGHVISAGLRTSFIDRVFGSARRHAVTRVINDQQSHAPSVASHSKPMTLVLQRADVSAEWPTVVSVERLSEQQPVYNISVAGPAEYFANGVLVHNSWRYPETFDMLQFGLRLGDDPRIIATTTPRPIKLIRGLVAAPTTFITRGSTFDNAANLAPTALAQLRARYEGTRLGRQELEGAILDDNPGALWQRDRLDANRIWEVPALSRVVVAVDPSGGDGPENDEQGIIVAGKDAAGRGYVLGDYTCKLDPNGWGREVVKAFHSHQANYVVAEANYGGAMVQHVIKTVDPSVPVKMVTATRGKALRAEPVAALDAQGKISHVGSFPELEDELCVWDPEGKGASPNRLDARVWAFTDLLVAAKSWTAI